MDEAILHVDETAVKLPAVVGTEGETAIDIQRLRSDTGVVTLDRGFANTAETVSDITFIDGEAGILRHRGFAIEDLAAKASFLEVAYLLYHGSLPTKPELDAYTRGVTTHSMLREEMRKLFEAFPIGSHPMQVMGAATSALATYYPDKLDPMDPEAVDISAKRLLAKLPTVAAWAHKHNAGQPFVYPLNTLDYASNFLQMCFAVPAEDYQVDPLISKALNMLFILHADHGQNCSASTVRFVGSGLANIFSSISAGIHALSGPRHGGANQAVVEMLEAMVAAGGDAQSWLERAKDRDDPFLLMGFGHRVYKNFDPRARIIKETARDILNKTAGDDALLERAMQLEDAALADEYFIERKLFPNVDFYSGIIYRAMGFPPSMFTALFAIGRLPGWIAQWKEMNDDPATRIHRPRQVYTGHALRSYVPIEER